MTSLAAPSTETICSLAAPFTHQQDDPLWTPECQNGSILASYQSPFGGCTPQCPWHGTDGHGHEVSGTHALASQNPPCAAGIQTEYQVFNVFIHIFYLRNKFVGMKRLFGIADVPFEKSEEKANCSEPFAFVLQ